MARGSVTLSQYPHSLSYISSIKAIGWAILFLLSFSPTSLGQISGTTAGIVPFGSYMPVEAGTVNLANLNILFEILLRNKPGFFSSSLAQNEVLWASSGGSSPAWVGPVTGWDDWNFNSTLGGGAVGTAIAGYKVAEMPTTPLIPVFTSSRAMEQYIRSHPRLRSTAKDVAGLSPPRGRTTWARSSW